jgi:ankyrin repeat protein
MSCDADSDADSDFDSQYGRTALHYAAGEGKAGVVSLLASARRYDICAKDEVQFSAAVKTFSRFVHA